MTSTAPWSCVLFDLDGTISDSASGITSTLAHTLETMGKPVPTPAQLVAFVGPPIMDGFAALGLTPDESLDALAIYRARYQERGALDSAVFDGLPETLRAVQSAGIPLALATSKPESQVIRMLTHYGLFDAFTFVGGASEDETRSEKADVVRYVIRNLRDLSVDVSDPVMVGDRIHDVEGASANGIPTIYVGWGYGSEEESVGAIARAATPAELRSLLGVA